MSLTINILHTNNIVEFSFTVGVCDLHNVYRSCIVWEIISATSGSSACSKAVLIWRVRELILVVISNEVVFNLGVDVSE
jgi:hypothetical protein